MARRRRGDEERSMDALMDALTNVVGILLLILIVSSLGISAAVKKVVENLPEVSQEELEAMRISRDKTLKNLQELQQTHNTTIDNLPTEEEAKALVAELEDFEQENSDLAEKTSDIEEWMAKVEEEKTKQEEFTEKVSVADTRNRELAAILAQTPEVEVKEAKDVAMPNPRVADKESSAFYLICKFDRLYFIGDPYEHAFRIRDVIDQNFADLVYTGNAIGSYTYQIKDTSRNDSGALEPHLEKYRLSRREREALSAWDQLKPVWKNREGVESKEASLLTRIFGADEEAELAVSKFRFDMAKITNFFGDGKFGPADFKYHVLPGGGDRIKLALEPKPEGGWTVDQFLAAGSQFEQYCKQAATSRRVLFYYYVAPDSFDTYLQARAKSEEFRVPAGWTVWDQDKVEPRAVPTRETTRYNLDVLPDDAYMKVANAVGPNMVAELNKEAAEFTARIEASVPEEVKDPAARTKFITDLTKERNDWNASRFQSYVLSIFQTALAAEEAGGEVVASLEIHPPEIPGIRIFQPSRPPSKPTPPPDPTKKPEPPKPPTGNTLILD
ncbi:MAG: hypothetical protein P1U81_03710 [Verrucomicrobiales bacterium]|nr:hypothetical protein [bacterium]MDF2375323.1 hypothetical protein [Verrucomicrobiales bacterium]